MNIRAQLPENVQKSAAFWHFWLVDSKEKYSRQQDLKVIVVH